MTKIEREKRERYIRICHSSTTHDELMDFLNTLILHSIYSQRIQAKIYTHYSHRIEGPLG